MTSLQEFENQFPRIRGTKFQITSPSTPTYNCFAWAAGDNGAIWEPVPGVAGSGSTQGGYFWPAGTLVMKSLDAFVRAFEHYDYLQCADGSFEEGFEKIAIFESQEGTPSHAARQLASGKWTSKLGKSEDVEHDAAGDLGGGLYGEPAVFMKRATGERPHPRMA